MDASTPPPTQDDPGRLVRPEEGRMIAGVAAALADKLGLDVSLVRLGFVIASFFGGFGIAVYLAAWVLVPDEGQTESPAERWFTRRG